MNVLLIIHIFERLCSVAWLENLGFFLPRDATQSTVMPQYVVCPSVCLWRSGTVIT